MAALLVFECNDTAGVAGWSVSGSHFQVHEKIALAGIPYFGHLVVFDGVLVAVGADAPDVHGEDFAVLVEGDGDDALVPALGPEDFNDVAVMLDGGAVVQTAECFLSNSGCVHRVTPARCRPS